jgi:nitrite reductase (NO-forming)
MDEETTSHLSDLLEHAASNDDIPHAPDVPVIVLPGAGTGSDRRAFLARASTLAIAVPALSSALAACSRDDTAQAPAATSANAKDSTRAQRISGGSHNADSRLDTALAHPPATLPTGIDAAALKAATFRRFAPELPPLPAGSTQQIHWHAKHSLVRIDSRTVVNAWTFEGEVPGPIVHTRVGDTVEFTLTNDEAMPHSMDFHAAQIDPKTAFRSVAKGQSVSFTFKPKFAGAYMYHCGTAPVLLHIGSGMYGAIIVSPREPLPAARDFVLVQSEYYLRDDGGVFTPDYTKMLSTMPDFVCFNGRPDQYISEPIRVKRGERVRFWLVNAGPTHPCSFHVVGEQFDTVYAAAPPASPLRGVQTWPVAPGGGMVFELVCDVAGEFPFVNHGFGHGQKGAIGILVVEP